MEGTGTSILFRNPVDIPMTPLDDSHRTRWSVVDLFTVADRYVVVAARNLHFVIGMRRLFVYDLSDGSFHELKRPKSRRDLTVKPFSRQEIVVAGTIDLKGSMDWMTSIALYNVEKRSWSRNLRVRFTSTWCRLEGEDDRRVLACLSGYRDSKHRHCLTLYDAEKYTSSEHFFETPWTYLDPKLFAARREGQDAALLVASNNGGPLEVWKVPVSEEPMKSSSPSPIWSLWKGAMGEIHGRALLPEDRLLWDATASHLCLRHFELPLPATELKERGSGKVLARVPELRHHRLNCYCVRGNHAPMRLPSALLPGGLGVIQGCDGSLNWRLDGKEKPPWRSTIAITRIFKTSTPPPKSLLLFPVEAFKLSDLAVGLKRWRYVSEEGKTLAKLGLKNASKIARRVRIFFMYPDWETQVEAELEILAYLLQQYPETRSTIGKLTDHPIIREMIGFATKSG